MKTKKIKLNQIYQKTNLLEFYGGGPIYGLNGVAIIGHGSSNVSTITNAIKTSDMIIENKLTKKIPTNPIGSTFKAKRG